MRGGPGTSPAPSATSSSATSILVDVLEHATSKAGGVDDLDDDEGVEDDDGHVRDKLGEDELGPEEVVQLVARVHAQSSANHLRGRVNLLKLLY